MDRREVKLACVLSGADQLNRRRCSVCSRVLIRAPVAGSGIRLWGYRPWMILYILRRAAELISRNSHSSTTFETKAYLQDVRFTHNIREP